MEIWKAIPGFEGLYEASNKGRIRSVARSARCFGGARVRDVRPTILKPYQQRNGYLGVTLGVRGGRKKCLVHRLIASTFLPKADGASDVNHKNLIKSDNRVSNLEWVTKSQNMQHAHDNGAFPPEPHRRAVACQELGIVFESSYQAAEWVNAEVKHHSGLVSAIASNIRASARGHTVRYGFHWLHVENEPSTTIPKGSTPKRVETGGPS